MPGSEIRVCARIAGEQIEIAVIDEGMGVAPQDCERIFEWLAGLLVETAEDVVDGTSLRVLELPAREVFRGRVQVFDDATGVRGDDRVADGAQRDLRALLLAEQRFLVDLALRDV